MTQLQVQAMGKLGSAAPEVMTEVTAGNRRLACAAICWKLTA